MSEKRTCSRCGQTKPINNFRESKPGYRRRVCNECMDAAATEWREKNKDRYKTWYRSRYKKTKTTQIERAKRWNKENAERKKANAASWYRRMRDEVLMSYGGECVCCGEIERSFLTIDHINDDGYRMRWKKNGGTYGPHSGGHLLKYIKDNDFPPDFQILCANCNTSKSLNNGVCAHNIKNVQRTILRRSSPKRSKAQGIQNG